MIILKLFNGRLFSFLFWTAVITVIISGFGITDYLLDIGTIITISSILIWFALLIMFFNNKKIKL